MSRLHNVALAAILGFAVTAPLYGADTTQNSQSNRSAAWSDAQVRAAMDNCNNLAGTARAKCIVNIRPAGGGGSSLAVGVADSSASENTVKTGTATEDEYAAELEKCGSKDGAARDRCVIDVKEHFGRM